MLRIDHVFVSGDIRVIDLEAPYTPLTRRASDHLPLAMTFEVE
jgi:endonuclease/exonuclease/phosphatase family metal-dependent hydrolase